MQYVTCMVDGNAVCYLHDASYSSMSFGGNCYLHNACYHSSCCTVCIIAEMLLA